MDVLMSVLFSILGVFMGSFLSILPGLHPLNFAGLAILLYAAIPFDPLALAMLFTGMLVGYAIVGTIVTTYFSAPDDSMMYTVFPNQKLLMNGRGYEAAMLTGIGSFGSMLLLLSIAPIASFIFPIFRKLTTPHYAWVLIGVVCYIIQSEWPKDWGSRAKTRFGRLKDGWSSLSAGFLTFILAMLLGFIILNRTVTTVNVSFQNLMPVFVGMIGLPWVLTSMLTQARIPKQVIQDTYYISKKDMIRGTTTGFLGGMFAAYEPVITAGTSGVLAGHSLSTSGDMQFMIGGSANRFAYYVGGFFLLWVPLLHLTRKGFAYVMSVAYSPTTDADFFLFLGAMAIAGIFSFLLLLVLSRVISKSISGINFYKIGIPVIVVIVALVLFFSGLEGLVLMVVAMGIGLIPTFFRSRRLNYLVGIFFPIMLSMAGVASGIVTFLGLY